MLIGYQGIKGSNSEMAAKLIGEKEGFTNVTYIPLVSSFNVLESIHQGIIDYGVIAIHNSSGGHVLESKKALKHIHVDLVSQITIPIEHFLFVKNPSVMKQDISQIISHSQAFMQCIQTLKTNYPKIPLISDEDTATAAMKLRLELLPFSSAVICRKEAGFNNGLHLLESHLEDRKDNTTTFHMYSKSKKDQ